MRVGKNSILYLKGSTNPFPRPFSSLPQNSFCPLFENPFSRTLIMIMDWRSLPQHHRKEVKCRSETPLPPGVFFKFCGYICWCGCVWSSRKCGKVEKKWGFRFFFFTMKSSRLIFFFFFVVRLVAKKVWESWKFCFHLLPHNIRHRLSVIFGKFPDISYQSSPRTGYKIGPIFFYKKT